MNQANEILSIQKYLDENEFKHILDCRLNNIRQRVETTLWDRDTNYYSNIKEYIFDDYSVIKAEKLTENTYKFSIKE